MVWCARESRDYVGSQAMVCHWHFGWIHWDPPTQSWHSVTNLQLSMPCPPTAEQAADAAQAAEGDAPPPAAAPPPVTITGIHPITSVVALPEIAKTRNLNIDRLRELTEEFE
jgi:hypothetical protein